MSDNRFVRLQMGSKRINMELNRTKSKSEHPYCVKSRSRSSLNELVRASDLDESRIFRGSLNHMIFVDEEEALEIFGQLLDRLDSEKSEQPNSQNKLSNPNMGKGHVVPLGGFAKNQSVSEEDDFSRPGYLKSGEYVHPDGTLGSGPVDEEGCSSVD